MIINIRVTFLSKFDTGIGDELYIRNKNDIRERHSRPPREAQSLERLKADRKNLRNLPARFFLSFDLDLLMVPLDVSSAITIDSVVSRGCSAGGSLDEISAGVDGREIGFDSNSSICTSRTTAALPIGAFSSG